MRPLRTGKGQRLIHQISGGGRSHPYLQVLMPQELDAGSSGLSAAGVAPEQRRGTNSKGMQQDTDLARLVGRAALPLALLAQRTGTAASDAGRIDDAQAVIGFSASFMREQMVVSRTPDRASGGSHRPVAVKENRMREQRPQRRDAWSR